MYAHIFLQNKVDDYNKLISAAADVGRERVKYGRRFSQLKWRRSRLNRITGRGELKHDEIR